MSRPLRSPGLHSRPPSGQAILESLILVVPLALVAVGLSVVFRVGLQESEAISAGRGLLDACRLDPQGCSRWVRAAGVQGLPSPEISIDRPVDDVGGQRPLDRLGDVLRGATQRAADQLFELPDPRSLVRVSVAEDFHWASAGRIATHRSLAMHTEDWATQNQGLAQLRVASGAEPSEAMRALISVVHAPATQVLMPLFESIGLERGSRPFSRGFHRLDWMRPFPGTQAPPGVRP